MCCSYRIAHSPQRHLCPHGRSTCVFGRSRQTTHIEASRLLGPGASGRVYARALAAADLSLALNGADFIPLTGVGLLPPYYLYDDTNAYFEPTQTAPLVGVVTGGTNVALRVPAGLPLLLSALGFLGIMRRARVA